MEKNKFNKSKCKKCVYGSSAVKGSREILCSFATRNPDRLTCLYKGDDGKLYDRRGDDYDNCKLFIKGKTRKSTEW